MKWSHPKSGQSHGRGEINLESKYMHVSDGSGDREFERDRLVCKPRYQTWRGLSFYRGPGARNCRSCEQPLKASIALIRAANEVQL